MRFYLEPYDSRIQDLDKVLPPVYRAMIIDTWIPNNTKLKIKGNDADYYLNIVRTELEYDPHAFSQQPLSGIMYVHVYNIISHEKALVK